jgi:hypothetical protein
MGCVIRSAHARHAIEPLVAGGIQRDDLMWHVQCAGLDLTFGA